MSIERTFRCDGPGCERHVKTQKDYAPMFLIVIEDAEHELHFCGWDCVLRFARAKEPEEAIPCQ